MSEVQSRPARVDVREQAGKPDSRRRGRRQGVDIKPGSAKRARLEAGLSLGQVATGVVSRTAIYYVETGKAKPSMETLRLIAERTGRPLDYFLSQPSTMEPRSSPSTAEIERLIATNDPQAALAAAGALLDQAVDQDTGARIKHLMATAHLRLAQSVDGRRLAVAARIYFEQTGDVLMTAECLGTEASAAYLMQDANALALAERGLQLCRSLDPVPQITEARLLAVLGGVYATNQDWQAAIECYEQAIAAGEVVHDLRRLSLMYSGLSLAYLEIGHLNQAADYGQRALAIHQTLNDRISLARSENNYGLLLLKRGDLRQAEAHIQRSLLLFDEAAVEIGKASVLLSLCELYHARGQVDDAEQFAQQALETAERTAEPATVAECHVWMGRLAATRGDDELADAEFAVAIGALEALGTGDRLPRCHVDYAEILEQRGDLAAANQHLKLAITVLRPSLATAQIRRSRTTSA